MNTPINLDLVLRRVKALPTLPHVFQAVSELTQDPEAPVAKIARVIETDQALTTRILGLVNSPFYGLSGKVTTVAHAVVILGFNPLRSVVLSASVVDLFQGGKDARFDFQAFWKHSIATAICSRILAHHAGLRDAESIFVAGLLHDVGKLVEWSEMSEPFSRILDRVAEGKAMHEVEMEILGFTHADVGRLLLQQWKLPEILSYTVGAHHLPSADPARLQTAAVVHVADVLCIAGGIGSGGNLRVPVMDRAAWDALHLQRTEVASMLDRTEKEAEETFAFFKPKAKA